mmetsp:Transcript_34654/g.107672  ORF Transcript_34654/g.107672 Transcript_34654/m.107672 type:complete len:409 (+) Transcript_34654:60-1286(+)
MREKVSDGHLARSSGASCCGCLCTCWSWFLLVVVYWVWHAFFTAVMPWHMFEERTTECGHLKHDLPANNSGVRALVYGLSKTGTKTMIRSIYRLGFEQSYHSEDLSLHVWSGLADDYWLRPENGGRRSGPANGIYAGFGRPFEDLGLAYSNDTKVLQALKPEDLRNRLAGCRVNAIAFDGMEHLFWPIYDLSPDAKVLILDWRTFEEFHTSRSVFGQQLLLLHIFGGVTSASVHALPWIFLTQAIDRLTGSPGKKLMLRGGPPLGIETGFLPNLYLTPFSARRTLSHLYSGLKLFIYTKANYEDFYKVPYERIPEERRMSWNMRKHGWKDLCAFLEVPAKDCPGTGLLPNEAPNWFAAERDSPYIFFSSTAFYMILHMVNWYVYRAGLTAYSSALSALYRSCRSRFGP